MNCLVEPICILRELVRCSGSSIVRFHCRRFFCKWEYSQQSLKGDSTTIDIEEVKKFHRLASDYWNKNGPLAALHSLNFVRVPLICNGLKASGVIKSELMDGPSPLGQLQILDVGCGGGILSEALASLGASVTGIDASAEMVQVAIDHCSQNPTICNHITYKCSSVEDLIHNAGEMKYDAVIASEVIEHVYNQDQFITCCVDLVKENGSLFFTTINKTWISYALAIASAEWLFSIVPKGTHDWNKFVSPTVLHTYLENNNCTVRLTHGICYNPLINEWSWTSNTSINYAVHAVKPKE